MTRSEMAEAIEEKVNGDELSAADDPCGYDHSVFLAAAAELRKTCEYRETEDREYWDTTCNHQLVFEYGDGTPSDGRVQVL